MKPLGPSHQNIEKVLKIAYKQKEPSEKLFNDQWQENVMRNIRQVGHFQEKQSFSELFDNFFWQFAPAICVFIIILTACLYNFDFTQEYGIAMIYLDDPLGFSLIQAF